ncbi:hypothetical protein OAQ99_07505 [Candidatus Kapabacteria bacterium]|nr:hypothetical protein [Candidatus Kapabacteria bacterium]
MATNTILSIITSLLVSLILFQLIFLVIGIDFDVLYQSIQWNITIIVFAIPLFMVFKKKVFKDIKKISKESYNKKIK